MEGIRIFLTGEIPTVETPLSESLHNAPTNCRALCSRSPVSSVRGSIWIRRCWSPSATN